MWPLSSGHMTIEKAAWLIWRLILVSESEGSEETSSMLSSLSEYSESLVTPTASGEYNILLPYTCQVSRIMQEPPWICLTLPHAFATPVNSPGFLV